MKQTLPNTVSTQNKETRTTAILVLQAKQVFTIFSLLLCLMGSAQTYTTRANGDWSDPATWVNGSVAPRTITSSMVVTINDDVTYDGNTKMIIEGVVNIAGDTLRFPSKFAGTVTVTSTGLLNVQNGGFLQDVSSHKNNLVIDGGRVVFTNANVAVSKNFDAINGASRFIRNSTVLVGLNYSLSGTSTSRVSDTIQSSTIEAGLSGSGDFAIVGYGDLKVANAIVKVANNNNFLIAATGTVSVLPKAFSNYGFTYLKVAGDLQNDGPWNARIDAAYIAGSITGSQMADIDFTRDQDPSTTPSIGAAPELVFTNPVLRSGTANKPGAIYRFANVITGVDAELAIKKFSRSDIVMQAIDLQGFGWEKALQPQFGLAGLVQPNQEWYVDFELRFYQAGTTTPVIMPKVDMTALDVDGDGSSIAEYAVFENPGNVIYSTTNSLVNNSSTNAGTSFMCPLDSLTSVLVACDACGGDGKTGMWNYTDCTVCNATGLLYTGCRHPFDGVNGNTLQGPVTNYNNIDTAAISVMATYQYINRNVIAFRYGARTGSGSSNGAGVRLNSVWFRQFDLAPAMPAMFVLPVEVSDFTATLNRKDVIVGWKNYGEKANRFVVQRSTDGKSFSSIATVFADESTGSYSYKDVNATMLGAIAYYRVLSISQAEKPSYTDVKLVRLATTPESDLTLEAFPNPARTEVHIAMPAHWQGKPVQLQLFTTAGAVAKVLHISSASQAETFDLTSLPKGIYVVKASCRNESAQQRLIKN